jgi:hypothetical protein
LNRLQRLTFISELPNKRMTERHVTSLLCYSFVCCWQCQSLKKLKFSYGVWDQPSILMKKGSTRSLTSHVVCNLYTSVEAKSACFPYSHPKIWEILSQEVLLDHSLPIF